jgi:single-strand DNA-binding protein
MNILNFVGRIGRDAELRDANGTSVINIAVAYNYGRKGGDGKRPTQWVDAALFGKRAEALEQYLVKGQQVAIAMEDTHVETYNKTDGTVGVSLRGNVIALTLVGDAPQQQDQQQPARQPARQPAPQQRQAPARQPAARQPAAAGGSGFDDMDDDIPF